MGETPVEPDGEAQPLAAFDLIEFCNAMAQKYALKDMDALEELWELMLGYANRDQYGLEDRAQWTDRRRDGHRLAKRMRDKASIAVRSMEDAWKAFQEFEAVVQSNPMLLEEIFDADFGPSSSMFMPEYFAVLTTLHATADSFDIVDGQLSQLAALPVKQRLNRGAVGNAVLRKAVEDCRTYWRDIERRNWGMYHLAQPDLRPPDGSGQLKGECERFVVDMLRSGDVIFTWSELYSAWDSADRTAPYMGDNRVGTR